MEHKVLQRWKVLVILGLLLGTSAAGWAKWEKEQVDLESQLQERIEGILSKTLSPNSYLVTVKVEMEDSVPGGVSHKTNTHGGNNPFLQQNHFVLPGVPEKKQFSNTPEVTEESTVVNPPVEALIKKISITVLVAPDVTSEQIRSLREFLSSAIPFNPLRGDELDIQNSPLLKSSAPSIKSIVDTVTPHSEGWERLLDRNTLPLVILLLVVAVGLFGVAAFLYGPVRGFFNRLLAVLPRVGEQAIYAANANNAATSQTANTPTHPYPNGNNGYTNGDNGAPKLNMPFQFIREEQLGKLALLFRELSPFQAALVLAYLPPAWASLLLSGLDAATQSAIMRELSQSREVPAEVVGEVEAQIKEKLPYLVGGADWIQAVYPLTQPQTQKVLLGTLSQQSPELAKSLRQKTFFFEDLGALGLAALRALVQDIGYPLMAQAIKDEKKEFRDAVLQKLPASIRDIVQQELELSKEDKKAIAEAKNRLVAVARRLLAEGRITLGVTQ